MHSKQMRLSLWLLMVGVTCAILFTSCTYNKRDLVLPPPPSCNTTGMRYSVEVVSILTTHCYSCHSGSASQGDGIKLDSYAQVQRYGASGALSGSINWTGGFNRMPKGSAKIPACSIAQIDAWIKAGMPNN